MLYGSKFAAEKYHITSLYLKTAFIFTRSWILDFQSFVYVLELEIPASELRCKSQVDWKPGCFGIEIPASELRCTSQVDWKPGCFGIENLLQS